MLDRSNLDGDMPSRWVELLLYLFLTRLLVIQHTPAVQNHLSQYCLDLLLCGTVRKHLTTGFQPCRDVLDWSSIDRDMPSRVMDSFPGLS